MMPPEPTRSFVVRAATCATRTAGEELASHGMLWVLGHPIALIADLFGELGQLRGMPEGIAQGRTARHGGMVEYREAEPSAAVTPHDCHRATRNQRR